MKNTFTLEGQIFKTMGKDEGTSKRTNVRTSKRAGLNLPDTYFRKSLRARLNGRHKISKYTPLAAAALHEFLMTALIMRSVEEIGDKKNIGASHIHAALNDTECDIYGVYPKNVTGFRV